MAERQRVRSAKLFGTGRPALPTNFWRCDAMHAQDFSRQQQEAMIASGALNKMTSLGMPKSRRSA